MSPIQTTPPDPKKAGSPEQSRGIKKIAYKTNIWMIIIPIVFIAVLFILYVFVWQEAMTQKKVGHALNQSKLAISDIGTHYKSKINSLEVELAELKEEIQENYTLIEKVSKVALDEQVGSEVTFSGTMATEVMQAPVIDIEGEVAYVDTEYGQMQIISEEMIECESEVTITGELNGIEGEENAEGKMSYKGYYVVASEYECLK